MNYKKKIFSFGRSSFSKDNLINYEYNWLNGKENLSKLTEGNKNKKVDKLDGKNNIAHKEEPQNL